MHACVVAGLIGLAIILAAFNPREALGQSASIEAFVRTLYVSLLGRQPDPQGLSSWTATVASDCTARGLMAVARAFVLSQEFADRPVTLVELATGLVRVVLGRNPTAAEQDAVVAMLRSRRVEVLRGFIRSPEFQSLVPDPRNPAVARALVGHWYAEILERAPTAEEQSRTVDYLVATGDVEGVAVGLLTSPEFERRALTFGGYVRILYRAILFREPDPLGLAGWTQTLLDQLLEAFDAVVGLPLFQARAEQICRSNSGNAWCAKGTPLQALEERFPGHAGPDVVVRTDLGHRLQDAVDSAVDVNGDGRIIVGVVAGPGGEPDGHLSERLIIARDFGVPFGLVGCGLTLHDPAPGEVLPTAWIRPEARSPDLVVIDVGATGSNLVGWAVQGDGRYLRSIEGRGNANGLAILGNRNTLHNGRAEGNSGLGIYVEGADNTITGNQVEVNGTTGIFLTGTGNALTKNAVGDRGRGNGGTGIHAEGAGNILEENTVLGNGGNGVEVVGGVASRPVALRKNQVGDRNRGNGGHGIVVSGTGNGGAGPVEIDENDVAGNLGDGVRVSGAGHQLQDNRSGGAGDLDNGGCEFVVDPGNLDGGGNRVNDVPLEGSGGSFPTFCLGTP